MEVPKKRVLDIFLAGSLIGLLSYSIDLAYHISINETEEVLGTTLLESATHLIPFSIFVVFIVIYFWQKSGKR